MKSSLRAFAFASVLATVSSAASAAATIFLFIPGVPGQSADDNHPGWIELGSMSAGVINRACSGITVTKTIDGSSPVLSTAALLGSAYPSMTMDFTVPGAAGSRSYLTYLLSNVTVSSVSQSTGGDLIYESVSLFPATLTITYKPIQSDGSAGTPVTYSLACAKK
jgi:type VI secretion system secreted protein Hcp